MPMVPKFFRAAAFAANVFGDMGAGDTNWLGAECEDLLEVACARPFFARFLHCCLYWLFCVKHVCTKAGVFVFGAVGKADHAVSFLRPIARKCSRRCLAAVSDFVSSRHQSFRQNLENRRRSASCHNRQETGIELFFQGLSSRWFQKPDHALNASNPLECFG